MKTIELELSVPTALSDITLGQYQRYMKVVEENEGDDNAGEFLTLKTIEIFCNISLKDVLSIPAKDADKVLTIINKAFEEKPNLITRFDLLGVDMGFEPKLENISLGAYIDVEDNISDWQRMHKAMAGLYRPVNFKNKDKYTVAPYEPSEEVSNLMKEMPLDVVMSAMVFFYDLGKELLRAIPSYIQSNLTEEQTYQLKQTLAQNGVGTNQYTDSLEETFSSLIKLPSFQYSSASTS
jgi:hypothetical protein